MDQLQQETEFPPHCWPQRLQNFVVRSQDPKGVPTTTETTTATTSRVAWKGFPWGKSEHDVTFAGPVPSVPCTKDQLKAALKKYDGKGLSIRGFDAAFLEWL